MRDKYNILCVDDEESVLKALKRRLVLEGYNVFAVSSPHEGLSILDREPIDMVISDQRMPAMNGFEFLQEVRKRHPFVLRILLSGYSDFDNLCKAVNDGDVFRFISKPWNSNELISLVREALGRKRTSRAADEFINSICRKIREAGDIQVVTLPQRNTVRLTLESNEHEISEESAAHLADAVSELLARKGEPDLNGLSAGTAEAGASTVTVSVDIGAGITLTIGIPLTRTGHAKNR